MTFSRLMALLADAVLSDADECSLLDGSDLIGDLNFRTDRFDCGTDPGGFYEDNL